jgi:hypothetical protein
VLVYCQHHTSSYFYNKLIEDPLYPKGNSRGVIFIYNLEKGNLVTKLEYRRIKAAVRAVVFAPSLLYASLSFCLLTSLLMLTLLYFVIFRHVVLVGYEPNIWRWSWEPTDKEQNGKDSVTSPKQAAGEKEAEEEGGGEEEEEGEN